MVESWQSWGKVVVKVGRSGKNAFSICRQDVIWKCQNILEHMKKLYSNISNTHIPKYPDFLSVNITLLLRTAIKLLSNIFCDMYLGHYIHFKKSFLLLASLASILFLKFSIDLLYTVLFINLYNAFLFLSSVFSLSVLFLC